MVFLISKLTLVNRVTKSRILTHSILVEVDGDQVTVLINLDSISVVTAVYGAVVQGNYQFLTPRILGLLTGRSSADFRISRLRFALSRLRFAWVSPGVVCGTDPGSGLYKYPTRDFEVVFSMKSDRK